MGGTNNGRGLITDRTTGAATPRRLRHRREALSARRPRPPWRSAWRTCPSNEASPLVDIVEMLDIRHDHRAQSRHRHQELVTQILSTDIVLTADNNVIVLYANAVGDSVDLTRYDATTKMNVTYDYTVTKVYTNSTTGDVDSVQLKLNG